MLITKNLKLLYKQKGWNIWFSISALEKGMWLKMNAIVLTNPIIQHKLSIIRNINTIKYLYIQYIVTHTQTHTDI